MFNTFSKLDGSPSHSIFSSPGSLGTVPNFTHRLDVVMWDSSLHALATLCARDISVLEEFRDILPDGSAPSSKKMLLPRAVLVCPFHANTKDGGYLLHSYHKWASVLPSKVQSTHGTIVGAMDQSKALCLPLLLVPLKPGDNPTNAILTAVESALSHYGLEKLMYGSSASAGANKSGDTVIRVFCADNSDLNLDTRAGSQAALSMVSSSSPIEFHCPLALKSPAEILNGTETLVPPHSILATAGPWLERDDTREPPSLCPTLPKTDAELHWGAQLPGVEDSRLSAFGLDRTFMTYIKF
jgi:hypothetical protein